ncbi:MAG: cytochrome-c peroxidase [Helicobacteraceae bacterium]|jgi:cytochrome c peroxidase|nr:cytochrome-c peroxidase [Helicobacteraceae bacterium]
MTKSYPLVWKVFIISAVIVMASAIYVIYFNPNLTAEYESLTVSGDASVDTIMIKRHDEPLTPIVKPHTLNADKIQLGERLFHDTRLSHNNTIACASCHNLSTGGVDRLPRSFGVGGKEGDINTPTVYNSSLNFVQFWDGRAKDLGEQAVGPIFNPVEMASNWDEALPKLRADSDLKAQFMRIYGNAPNESNVIDAIVEFERSLITPSRMDRWLLGDDSALSKDELNGYRLFVQYGCVACHQGEGVGGNLFQRFGVMSDYFEGNANIQKSDYGRFNVTGREEDKFVFKVPSLRNVALTPPYFHNAAAATLEEAVARMGFFQLGVDLRGEDAIAIAKFLEALNGEDLP